MESKQVWVIPTGIYYICPYCKEQMKVEYYCNYCPDCGNGLLWDNVKEFTEINSHSCYYEDVDGRCEYYGEQCVGSENCNYVRNDHILNKHIGRLTYSEKRNLLYKKWRIIWT